MSEINNMKETFEMWHLWEELLSKAGYEESFCNSSWGKKIKYIILHEKELIQDTDIYWRLNLQKYVFCDECE